MNAKKAAVTRAPRPCEDRLDEVFAWLDGELSPARARVVERHVASCDRCGGLAEDLRRAIAACRLAGDCRIPATIHRRARARALQLLRAGRHVPARKSTT
ncbi:MAG: zf-HC2 domain-containing protein [Acidobacteria bacterium]|nr:zf-HC2 domain-containing protein [Acidobacteriota bacterium]